MDEYEERTLSVIAPEQQVRIAGCTDHHTSCAGFFFAEIQKVRSQKSEDVSPRGPSGWNWLSSLGTGTQIWFDKKWSDLVRGGRAVRFKASSRQACATSHFRQKSSDRHVSGIEESGGGIHMHDAGFV